MTDNSTPYVTLEAAAKHFLVSISTFRGWVRNGIIPHDTFIQLGTVYRFDLPAVEAALKARVEAHDAQTTGENK